MPNHRPSELDSDSSLRIVYHPDYQASYYTSTAESPVRVKAIFNKLCRHFDTVQPDSATIDDILRVHERNLLLQVRNLGDPTYRTALLAAGGALCAAKLAVLGWPSFAIIRPPGHHAGRSRNGRFCFFNNMAVAMAWILATQPVKRVVIVDIDMHHGDGTAEIFADDPRVRLVDVWARDRRTYLETLFEQLEQVDGADFIAVSAGFDWSVDDWGGLLELEDFHQIGRRIHGFAAKNTRGHRFGILEGGYAVHSLPRATLAFCRGFENKPWPPS